MYLKETRNCNDLNSLQILGVILNSIKCVDLITYLLHGAEYFLRSYSVLSWSRNTPHFKEPDSLLPRSQEPATEHINTNILIGVPCIFCYFVL